MNKHERNNAHRHAGEQLQAHQHMALLDVLIEVLRSFQAQFVKGMSEFELITCLQEPPHRLFDKGALSDPLVLFQTHFVLFHALYQLRDQWRTQGLGELEIVATQISLNPPLCTASNLQNADPLGDYYLNWENLHSTTTSDVEALLTSFWEKMLGPESAQTVSEADINEALLALELKHMQSGHLVQSEAQHIRDPQLYSAQLSIADVKQQYRKLQHSYHPDKGGTAQQSQRILSAYKTLCRYLAS